EAEEQARRRAQDEADRREYARLLDAARAAQAKGRLDEAVASLQAAKRLRPGDEVERLLTAALVEQSRRQAKRQGEQARRDLEAKLAAEKAARDKAEAEARVRAQADAEARRQAQERQNAGEGARLL